MRTRWFVVAWLVAGALFLLAPSAANAVSLPNAEPPAVPTIQVAVRGGFAKDRPVQFAVVATHPGTWIQLGTVTVSMLVNEQPVQEVVVSVPDQTLAVTGGEPVALGSPMVLEGSFFSVDPMKVRFVRETFGVRVTLPITPRESIPPDAVFRASAVDSGGEGVSVRRVAPIAQGFLSWWTLGLAVAAAMLLGTLTGHRFASARHRQQEPSVWDIVERRLRLERSRPPAVAVTNGGAG